MLITDLLQTVEPETYCTLIIDMQYWDEGTAEELLKNYEFGEQEVTSIEVEDNGQLRIKVEGSDM